MPTVRDRVGRNTPLGANIVPGGVTFRVLAPAAREMYVLTGASLPAGQAPGFAPSASDQLFNLGDNTWGAFLPGLGEGDPYRFWVVGSAGSGSSSNLTSCPAAPRSSKATRASAAWSAAGAHG